MNKTVCLLAAFAALLVLSTSACSLYAPVIPVPVSSIPTLAAGPTRERVSTGELGTQPSIQGGGDSGRIPVCDVSSSCQAFDAEQIPLDCVKKIPYTNVLVPIGTKFEVVDTSGNFTCVDTGVVVNGKEVITCHGLQLYSFELKLTNAACGDGNLASGTDQCQDGYGYNAAGHCCAPIPVGTDGSVTVRVNLGACPVPNP